MVTTRVFPNLEINKLDDPDPVSREGLLEYTLRVRNLSNVRVDGVSVEDELPLDDVDFVRVERGDFASCKENAGFIRCTGGVLAPREADVVRIIVEPETAGTIRNTGAVFIREFPSDPVDEDTETTTVRGNGSTGGGPGDGGPGGGGPGGGTNLPEGDECSPVVRLGTEEPIGVLRGTTAQRFTFTNTFNETLPLRVVYATNSEDGTLDITITPEDGGEAILDRTISGEKRDVIVVDTESGATYDIEILPEDQGYAVLFEIDSGTEACTDPADLDPDVASSDDPQDDVIDDTIPDDPLPDTGGPPLLGVAILGLALVVAGASVIRGRRG